MGEKTKQIVWELFKEWCRQEGVNVEDHRDDWIHFWQTWSDGFKAGYKFYKKVKHGKRT